MFMHYCSFSVIWFLIPVSVYRFGELWILFMGVRVSESVALLRTCPPLSVKSAVAHANTNAHASVLLHGKITVTQQAEQCETSLAIQQYTLHNYFACQDGFFCTMGECIVVWLTKLFKLLFQSLCTEFPHHLTYQFHTFFPWLSFHFNFPVVITGGCTNKLQLLAD